MARTFDELLMIARAGGGFTIDGRNFSVADLETIGRAAAGKKARIHITNTQSLDAQDLLMIARAGDGAVSFDL